MPLGRTRISPVCRTRPSFCASHIFGIPETQANLHGMAEVLQLLRLFHGARVLDFGAGTGWFSRMLACLDCQPVAVDVSPVALGLGRSLFSRDPAMAGLSIDWRPYDGVRLPLDDGSVDRIVCYDSVPPRRGPGGDAAGVPPGAGRGRAGGVP